MVDRVFRISSCCDCPHLKLGSGRTRIGYLPTCVKSGAQLPFSERANDVGHVLAMLAPGIPDFCPLEIAQDAQKSEKP